MYEAASKVISQKNIISIEGTMGGGVDGRTNRWTDRWTHGRTDEEKGNLEGQTLL